MISERQAAAPDGSFGSPKATEGGTVLLASLRLGGQVFAVPIADVERILPMVALAALPEASGGVVGVLDLQGDLLPVVDPRPRLGIPTEPPHPNHRLLIATAAWRFAVWVDEVERLLTSTVRPINSVFESGRDAVIAGVAEMDGVLTPVLSLDALDPGPIAVSGSPSERA